MRSAKIHTSSSKAWSNPRSSLRFGPTEGPRFRGFTERLSRNQKESHRRERGDSVPGAHASCVHRHPVHAGSVRSQGRNLRVLCVSAVRLFGCGWADPCSSVSHNKDNDCACENTLLCLQTRRTEDVTERSCRIMGATSSPIPKEDRCASI